MPESSHFTEQLRDKALLALEDAIQETRYRTPRESYSVRFALAYLWAYGGAGDRAPYDELWRQMRAPHGVASFSGPNRALTMIYRALGVERVDAVESLMWQRWTAHEGHGGHHSGTEGRRR